MSIARVFSTLSTINETSGSKNKESLLRQMSKHSVAHEFMKHATDKTINLWVTAPEESACPLWKGRNEIQDIEKRWEQFKKIFLSLSKREVTGKAAQTLLMNFIGSCSNVKPYYEGRWYIAAVNRHLNIGVGPAKIQSIWPDLVSDFGVQLAKSLYDQKTGKVVPKVKAAIKLPLVMEPKLDGMNVSIVSIGNEGMGYSRRNIALPSIHRWSTAFNKALKLMNKKGFTHKDFVINGEFKSDMRQTDPKGWKSSWGKTMALCHAGVTPTGYDPADVKPYDQECLDKDLYFVIYNCYPVSIYTDEDKTWNVPYGHTSMKGSRSWLLKQIVAAMKHIDPKLRIEVIEQKIAKTWVEAKEIHDSFIEEGHEGSMIKQINDPCVLTRGVSFVKWKVYKDVDAIILGVTKGTGKYVNSGGALVVYIPEIDDIAKCTARTEEIRRWFWDNKGSVSGFNVEISADGSDDSVAKIRNPVLKRFRYDVAPASPRDVIALCHRFGIDKPISRITPAAFKAATASFIAE
jgi:hypothetical protein